MEEEEFRLRKEEGGWRRERGMRRMEGEGRKEERWMEERKRRKGIQ